LDGVQKEILAARTIRAVAPHKAIDDAILAVRRELIQDLGVQALSEASCQVDHVAQAGWLNWRRLHSNIILSPERRV
jgi:hypothetical protein